MHNLRAFRAGNSGNWQVLSISAARGETLPQANALEVVPVERLEVAPSASWTLHGVISNVRYATRSELTTLGQRQEGLGRSASTRAAMIPIRKSAAWWTLAQDERRAIFEETSKHNAIGLDYLPAVARQLYHCRDIGEPFDFVTWFEYAPQQAAAFEDLVGRLRSTQEWSYVEREVDIRLERG